MNALKRLEWLTGMDVRTWRRHANLWSGWTRRLAFRLFCLAVLSSIWLGGWAVVPVALSLAFIWINPRLFPAPARLDVWMSRGELGERLYLTHGSDIPAHHRRAARILVWLGLPGLVVMLWGLATFWWEGVIFGVCLVSLPKLWFLDWMVWILQDWQASGHAVPWEVDNAL